MKVIILFICVFFPYLNYAQTSFPSSATNPTWRVAVGTFFGPSSVGFFKLGNDTVINGKRYEKVMASFPPNFIPTVSGYIRNEGKKVYVRTMGYRNGGNLSNEKLMYDFSLEVNKRIHCAMYSLDNPNDSTICWAESIDSMVFMGIKRKIWNMRYIENTGNPNDPGYVFTWIEGVGSLTHPFLPFVCVSSICESYSAILCLEDSSILKYTNPNYQFCGVPLTNVRESIIESEVKLYPHLASYQLTVENNHITNLRIDISNSLGQLFITKQLNQGVNTIDINELASGIYFALISDGYKRRVEKFVKQ
jgi:Secretion system C-terminal sorting domain